MSSAPWMNYAQPQGEKMPWEKYAAPSAPASIQDVPGAVPGMAEPNAKPAAPELKPISGPIDLLRGAGAGLRDMVTHPLQTARGFVQPLANVLPKYTNVNGVLLPIPNQEGIQNTMQEMRQIKEQPYFEAGRIAAPALATAGLVKGAKVALPEVGNMVESMRPDPLHEYRSPMIPQPEAVARGLNDIIKPSPTAARSVQSTLTQYAPDLRDFFEKSGVQVKNPLVFAKGAETLGKQATDFYKQNFIDPLADAPAGSQTVGQAYARVSSINDQLRPMYRAQTMGEQLSKEAAERMQALEEERDKLNGVIYQTLSDRSGLPVEQIQEINRRGASLQNVGDVTDAAQRLRRQGFQSPGVPFSKGQAAMRLIDYLRGGPEAVAGRKMTRVLGEAQGAPSQLPNPADIANYRSNFAAQEADAASANQAASAARKPAGLGPSERLGLGPIVPDVEGAQRLLQELQPRRTAQAASVPAADRSASLMKNLREQELLERARDIQQRAKTLRK